MNTINFGNLHERIVLDTLGTESFSDQDYFLLFSILHNYAIMVNKTRGIEDSPDTTEIAAITQRHAGEVLGALWKTLNGNGKSSSPEANYLHWYHKWNTDWKGYDHFANLTDAECGRLAELKQLLESHPLVKEFQVEDTQSQ